MIRSAVDQEFRTVVGIVCCHAHIYTDTVAASEELQTMAEQFFRELREKLTKAGLLKTDHHLAGTPTREGGRMVALCGAIGDPENGPPGRRCTLGEGHPGQHMAGRYRWPRARKP